MSLDILDFFAKYFFEWGVYLVMGGVWEKRGVICVDYGVWGAQVPSEPFGGVGVGGGTGLGLDISYG